MSNFFRLTAFIFIITLFCTPQADAQTDSTESTRSQWVDSVYNSLSLEQRIGQLLVVRANQAGKEYNPNISKYIKDYNIGGVTFFRNEAINQLNHTNEWQSLAQTPLLISIDAEWGVGMRLNEVIRFPYQMTLGAIQNDSLIYEMGLEVAEQCKRLGIQMNFAPVIDINVNAKNPVINFRSFGEDKHNVSRKGLMYMHGLQDKGILTSAKHFPGHGDTGTDSHHNLPIINHSKERLDSIELYPFKELMKNNLDGVMIAHLYIPEYETEANTASTLSYNIVTALLKEKLGFEGLIVTDALDMSGVTKYFKPGIIEQKALMAGNDILLLPQDVPKAIRKIKKAVEKGDIPEQRIEESCKKILAYKFKAGLTKYEKCSSKNLLEDLNNERSKFLNQKLFENALTIVKNTDSILPLKNLDQIKIASVGIGFNEKTKFQERLDDYATLDHFYLKKESSTEKQNTVLKELEAYDLVIVAFQNTSVFASKDFGITSSGLNFMDKLQNQNEVILDIFANPYSLAFFNDSENLKAIVMSYEDKEVAYDLSAQLIFGGIGAKGKLPVTASELYPINTGIETPKSRLKFGSPQDLGLDHLYLELADSIASSGLKEKAYPGCQIIGIKDGVIFYNKVFGSHTYSKTKPVKHTDLYDIASITKIAATTISLMKLQEEKLFDIDQKLSEYLPYLRNSNKGDIIIRDLLTHQARLQAWIPYYKSTLDGKLVDPNIYQSKISEKFSVRVAENLYISDYYKHHIIDSILNSPLREKNDYKYSDLGFYLLASTIENITNQRLDVFAKEQFYQPLGLKNISFLPREKYSLDRIPPTENDKEFRHQTVHGDVHDPGAAMMGGVSGHAGLFSSAQDLAVIMQMLINGGTYGGTRYLDAKTIKDFTRCQFPLNENRRGLGFDKPLLEYEEDGAVCFSASADSFGHSGFTGTYTWADPQNGLIYVFLSNRIHPDASNPKIMEMNIRTEIHEAFYQAIKNAK